MPSTSACAMGSASLRGSTIKIIFIFLSSSFEPLSFLNQSSFDFENNEKPLGTFTLRTHFYTPLKLFRCFSFFLIYLTLSSLNCPYQVSYYFLSFLRDKIGLTTTWFCLNRYDQTIMNNSNLPATHGAHPPGLEHVAFVNKNR